jgi:hypothetical protein
MRSPSLRALASVAARHGMHMHRWDFVTAFLQGSLEPGEVVYCRAAPGYATTGKDGRERIIRVDKPIYGMAQAGRRWQRSLFPWFIDQGFTQLGQDSSVFCKSRTDANGKCHKLIVGCYVDDLCVLYGDDCDGSLYSDFIASLQDRWNVEDEGPVNDLLNVDFTTESDGTIKLSQANYIDKMVERYLPADDPLLDDTVTPCDSNLEELVRVAIAAKESGATVDEELQRRYQSIIGSLLYCATNSRPDIAFAVGYLGRAMSCPTPELYDVALRVLRYLRAHRTIGLRYAGGHSRPLQGMSDASWAVRHSTSGSVFLFGEAAITWSSKKQPSVALSSCEAEIMAASEATKEAVYLRAFLDELGEGDAAATRLAVDNKAAIDLAYNPEHHQKTKHIDRRHFYIREVVESGRIVVPFVASADNLADFFTKPLDKAMFFAMRNRIMNVC